MMDNKEVEGSGHDIRIVFGWLVICDRWVQVKGKWKEILGEGNVHSKSYGAGARLDARLFRKPRKYRWGIEEKTMCHACHGLGDVMVLNTSFRKVSSMHSPGLIS